MGSVQREKIIKMIRKGPAIFTDRVEEITKSKVYQDVSESLNVTKEVLVFSLENAEKAAQKLQELIAYSSPIVSELLLAQATIGGPLIFMNLMSISTTLVWFGKNLGQRLNKPEEVAESRSLTLVANMWSQVLNVYHDHQVYGMENIPSNTAALLVWYHGPVPMDYIGLVAKIYLRDGRLVHNVIDRSIAKIPGMEEVEKHIKIAAYDRGQCVDLLENGQLVGVAPGGAREACFDYDCSVDWGHRRGFAKVALLAGVPIIPIFTENCREAYCTMEGDIWKSRYEKTRVPMVPVYGGFPVRLTTHVGAPIRAQPDETAEQLGLRVQETMQEMVAKYQKDQDKGLANMLMDRFKGQHSVEEKTA